MSVTYEATVTDSQTLELLVDGDSFGSSLTLSTEAGIPVITFNPGTPSATNFKYARVSDLERGYQTFEPSGLIRVSRYQQPQGGALSVGAFPTGINLAGQCGMPLSDVSEASRRSVYNEFASRIPTSAFQSDASARSEINGISTPVGYGSKCEATSAQLYAFVPSFNAAIEASNRLNNGPPLGLRCPAGGGAATQSACAATQMAYAMKLTAFMCHHVCSSGQ